MARRKQPNKSPPSVQAAEPLGDDSPGIVLPHEDAEKLHREVLRDLTRDEAVMVAAYRSVDSPLELLRWIGFVIELWMKRGS